MITLRGTALHRGGPSSVTLSAHDGPLTFEQRGARATLADLSPLRTDRGVTVATADRRVEVDLIEHLLAAIGGLGVGDGLLVAIDGEEIPLLDGGARAFAEALSRLDLPRSPPRLVVARDGVVARGASTYSFRAASTRSIEVEVRFPPPVGHERAAWDGSAERFADDIAPARTFGWVHEIAALRAAGRAAAPDLDAVMVFDDRGVIEGCRAPAPCEVARHKLLDLIGDLALYGGPPIGAVRAVIPGHGPTHAIVSEALKQGIVERR